MDYFKLRAFLQATVSIFMGVLASVAVLVYFALSYRMDPVSIFKKYSNYNYSGDFEHDTKYQTLWWIHRVSAITWTIAILQHLSLVMVAGKIRHVHEFLGGVVITATLGTATCGIIMVLGWDNMRYDSFTKWFVIVAFIVNMAFFIAFIIFRWKQGQRFPPFVVLGDLLIKAADRSGCCSSFLRRLGESLKHYKMRHQHPGFCFIISPFAQVCQFIFYSIFIREKEQTPESDYTAWKAAMFGCMIASMSFAYLLHRLLFIAEEALRFAFARMRSRPPLPFNMQYRPLHLLSHAFLDSAASAGAKTQDGSGSSDAEPADPNEEQETSKTVRRRAT